MPKAHRLASRLPNMAEPIMETYEKAMLLPATSSNGGDRPSARWKPPSLPDMACFGPVGGSACPCRDCREYGPRENRKCTPGANVADALRSAESPGRVTPVGS